MKHITIPIFVPHCGCPCQCSFCNQRAITGVLPMTPAVAKTVIEEHLSTIPPESEVEIAFFGGSFTAIEQTDMVGLLQVASPYLQNGTVTSIRISTRPDAIHDEILSILVHYGVKTVELGIQSMDDKVLLACRRGHTAADTYRAAQQILGKGLTLGGQMMIGLPSSTPETEEETARTIVAMGATEARIYPTVVFAHTPLAEEMAAGLYTPLSVEDAVARTVGPLEVFENANVKLLRVGLCETEGLRTDRTIVGGAYHPAMGELCYNALYFKRIAAKLCEMEIPPHAHLKLSVAPGKLSIAIGQRRRNLLALQKEFGVRLQFAEDPTLTRYDLRADLLS